MRRLAWTVAVTAALCAAAAAMMAGTLRDPVRWTPDALFYQARTLQLQGADRPAALREAFGGPQAAALRAVDPDRSGDPDWVAYHAPFFDRRLTVPLAAAALDGVRGDRALLDLSAAGYVAAVLALFVLLRLRFAPAVAGCVALGTVFLPALVHHSGFPLTDSWGLALQTLALAFALLALSRGPRWLVPWGVTLLVLSFTRDSVWVPVAGAVLVALKLRSRITLALAGTGVAASLPVLVAFPLPARELLATMLNGAQPVADPSWGFIAERYAGAVVDKLHADGGFVLDGAWWSAAYLLAGLGLLFVLARGRRGGPFETLLKGCAVAGAAYVLAIPVFSAFRLELALVPMAAWGLALGLERSGERLAALVLRRPGRTNGISYRASNPDVGSASR